MCRIIKEINVTSDSWGLRIQRLYPCLPDENRGRLSKYFEGKLLHPVISPLGELRARLNVDGSVSCDVWDRKRKHWIKGSWRYCKKGIIKQVPEVYTLIKKRKVITFYLIES